MSDEPAPKRGRTQRIDVTYPVQCGDWTLVSEAPRVPGLNRKANAVCKCGNQRVLVLCAVLKGRTTRCATCSAALPQHFKLEKENHHKWTGCGDLHGVMVYRYRSGAAKRGFAFGVDAEYLWDLFQRQGGLCALSGLALRLGKRPTASLDRIDSALGYVSGNVQWVHKDLNRMKQALPQGTFIWWCQQVARHRPELLLVPPYFKHNAGAKPKPGPRVEGVYRGWKRVVRVGDGKE